MKILILAGGFATRLWPLTEKRAKPLLLLDGKTILAHILEQVPAELDCYLLTNKKFEADFRQELQHLGRESVRIFCEDAHSDNEKVGALGAVSLLLRHERVKDDLVVVAGDNLLPQLDISQLFCTSDEGCVAVRDIGDLHMARKFGVVETNVHSTKEGKIEVVSFEEKPAAPKSTLVSTGFFGMGKNLLPLLHDFAAENPDNLGGVFGAFLESGKKVWSVTVGGEWFDVGSFETYLKAHEKLQHASVCCSEPSDEGGNVFSGRVFVGKGARVKNCRIRDSIIYPGTVLNDCHISQSVIDENCDFRGVDLSRKLIRRGTRLYSEQQKSNTKQ